MKRCSLTRVFDRFHKRESSDVFLVLRTLIKRFLHDGVRLTQKRGELSHLPGFQHEAVACVDFLLGVRVNEIISVGRSLDAGDGRHVTLLHADTSTHLRPNENTKGGEGGDFLR